MSAFGGGRDSEEAGAAIDLPPAETFVWGSQPMRYAFVVNDGNFLVDRTGLGTFADIEPAFEALVTSLRFDRLSSP